MIDEEIKALARLALANALYKDLSALVASYKSAAEGLLDEGEDFFGDQLGFTALVDSSDAKYDLPPIIWFRRANGNTAGVDSLFEALNEPEAHEIFIDEQEIFRRTGDGWYYYGD